jgi:hypothetical protein
MTQKKLGRPPTKLEDLPEGWQEDMLKLAQEGGSDVEMRAYILGIGNDTWYGLIDREPIFQETVKKCKLLCQAWWERSGRTSLCNKEFSYTGWYMNMKNRFGWKDKAEDKNDIVVPQIILNGVNASVESEIESNS